MPQVDELSIAIESDGNAAEKQLDAIIEKIQGISKALGKFGSGKALTGLANNIANLSSAFNGIGGSVNKATKDVEYNLSLMDKTVNANIKNLMASFKDMHFSKEGKAEVQELVKSLVILSNTFQQTLASGGKTGQLEKQIDSNIDEIIATVNRLRGTTNTATKDWKELNSAIANMPKINIPKGSLTEATGLDRKTLDGILQRQLKQTLEGGTQAFDSWFQELADNGFGHILTSISEQLNGVGTGLATNMLDQIAVINEVRRQYALMAKERVEAMSEPQGKDWLYDQFLEMVKQFRQVDESAKETGEVLSEVGTTTGASLTDVVNGMEDFTSKVGEMATQARDAASAIKDIRTEIALLTSGCKAVTDNVDAVSDALGRIANAVMGNSVEEGMTEMANNAIDADEAITETTEQAQALSDVLDEFKTDFDTEGIVDLEDGLQTVIDVADGAQSALDDLTVPEFDNVTPVDIETQANTNDAQADAEELKKKYEQIKEKALEISNAMKKVAQDTKDVLNSAKHIVGAFARATLPIKTLQRGFKQLEANTSKMGMAVVRIYRMLRLMVLRSVLRAMISGVGDGFKNLIQYSDEFDRSISLLWNDLRQLGNSIAAMAMPLINTFAPAIDMIIQKIISLINVVNQLFSALTGGNSWTRAKKLTDDYRKSLDKANKSQSKSLQGFDELNNITTSKDEGTSPKDMFEEVPIDDKWLDWAEKLKKAWKDGDFFAIGKEIGDWLANFLADIPWDEIRQQANKLGKSLATLLNGIMSGFARDGRSLGFLLGYTIAQALNTAFEFLNGFVHHLEWQKLGWFIAQSFNGLFETIDWDLIQDTFHTGAKGLADSINSFVREFHWNNISDTISKGLNTITDAIYTFFSETDFGMLGEKISYELFDTIRKIDWKKAGKAFGSLIQSLMDFIVRALSQLDVKAVANALGKFFKGVAESCDLGEVATILVTALFGKMLLNIGAGWASALGAKISTEIALGLAKASASLNIKAILTPLFTQLQSALIPLAEGVSVAMKAPISGLMETIATEGASASVIGATIGTTLIGSIVAAIGGFELGKFIGQKLFPEDAAYYAKFKWSEFFETIIFDAHSTVEAIKLWNEDISQGFRIIGEEISMWATETADSIGQWALETSASMKQWVEDMDASIDNWITQTATNIANFLVRLKGAFFDWGVELKNIFSDLWTSIINGFSNFFKNIGDKIDGLKEKLSFNISVGGSTGGKGIRAFASGGFPKVGEFFLARESGAEMVGSMGNKTTVANNDQIVAGIANGVSDANAQQNALLGEMITYLAEIASKDLTIGDDAIGNAAQRYASSYSKRNGGRPAYI